MFLCADIYASLRIWFKSEVEWINGRVRLFHATMESNGRR